MSSIFMYAFSDIVSTQLTNSIVESTSFYINAGCTVCLLDNPAPRQEHVNNANQTLGKRSLTTLVYFDCVLTGRQYIKDVLVDGQSHLLIIREETELPGAQVCC